MRTIDEIRERIADGSATILTVAELKRRVGQGDEITGSVDVVTCGTCGVMSGTYAVLTVPVAPPGTFVRADAITLNGVPAIPGPCPNERLGLVDLIVFGTAHASPEYGGGNLIQDIIAGREIAISVSADGKTYASSIRGSEIPHARLFTTRSAFKNYTAFTNSSRTAIDTIFSVTPLLGDLSEVTVSGCGEINPLENDPSLRFLTPGTAVLLNGGPGYIIGTGTRSSVSRPNIAVHGEMSGMDPHFCGGFKTSAGPECITSIATAIPVLDEAALLPLLVRDPDIPLPVVDLPDRHEIGISHYGRVWQDTSRSIRYLAESCLECSPCRAEQTCPVHAIHDRRIDQNACFVCGTCISVCPGGCYSGTLGSLPVGDRTLPVRLRQSDRRRAEQLCDLMREKILSREIGI